MNMPDSEGQESVISERNPAIHGLFDCKIDWLSEEEVVKKPLGMLFDHQEREVIKLGNRYIRLTPKSRTDPPSPRYVYMKDLAIRRPNWAMSTDVILLKDTWLGNRSVVAKRRGMWNENQLEAGQLLARFNHPNVQSVYDIAITGQADHRVRQLYVIGEYLPGGSLLDWIGTDHEIQTIAQIIDQIAQGLSHIHTMRYIHADIKPEQILLTTEGAVKICDFDPGISYEMDENGVAQTSGAGSFFYMPPEQRDGKLTVQSDIFSFAAVVFQMLNGDRECPKFVRDEFVKDPENGLIPIRSDLLSVISSNPDLHKKLTSILRKAMESDPQKRYDTVKEFNAELQEIFAGFQ